MTEKRINLPKKGSGRRLASRLKRLGEQQPPKDFVQKINTGEWKITKQFFYDEL
jgi:hypothetical protein